VLWVKKPHSKQNDELQKMKYTKGILIPASIPESYELICAGGRSSDLLPPALSSHPDLIGTVTIRMDFGVMELTAAGQSRIYTGFPFNHGR